MPTYLQNSLNEEDAKKIAAGLFLLALTITGWTLTRVTSQLSHSSGTLAVSSGNNTFTNIPDIPNTGLPASAGAGVALDTGMVSFDLDEGFESAYLYAVPILEQAKYKATVGVIPEYVGYDGYINEAQIRALQKRGHEIDQRVWTDRTEYALDIGSDTTFEQVKKAIDTATKEKKWLILVFHRVDESMTHDGKNVPHEFVQKIVTYVRQQGVRVVTNDEGIHMLGALRSQSTALVQ